MPLQQQKQVPGATDQNAGSRIDQDLGHACCKNLHINAANVFWRGQSDFLVSSDAWEKSLRSRWFSILHNQLTSTRHQPYGDGPKIYLHTTYLSSSCPWFILFALRYLVLYCTYRALLNRVHHRFALNRHLIASSPYTSTSAHASDSSPMRRS